MLIRAPNDGSFLVRKKEIMGDGQEAFAISFKYDFVLSSHVQIWSSISESSPEIYLGRVGGGVAEWFWLDEVQDRCQFSNEILKY